MDKQKFGKIFYISSLILAIIVFIIGRILLPDAVIDEDEYFRPSDLNKFIVFGFIIPIGILVREFLMLPYVKKIMILKVIVFSLIFIGGFVIYFVFPTVSSSIIVYLAYASLIFMLVPSNSLRKIDKE